MLGLFCLIAGVAVAATPGEKGNITMEQKERKLETAVFAGGCFWCMESDFQKVEGVVKVVSGYTGGEKPNPTYEEVSTGKTGHFEAVQVHYDPERISYRELLEIFWRHVDPTDDGGQFVDRGPQYRTAVFYQTPDQRDIAEASKQDLNDSGRLDRPVATEILALETFYPAEEYHQDYHKKNPTHYRRYRAGSRRDKTLERVWNRPTRPSSNCSACSEKKYEKPDRSTLKNRLTPMQFNVTQEDGTEPPFRNQYWDNHEPGLYVDIVSGEPLFLSVDKFDSGTGWPSFTRPVEPENIVEREDRRLGVLRTEVRSRLGDSHLGHVFPDGPPPTGKRYCINSAALRFIPKEDLDKEGYGKYLKYLQ